MELLTAKLQQRLLQQGCIIYLGVSAGAPHLWELCTNEEWKCDHIGWHGERVKV